MIGIGSPRASLEANFALRSLVGAENFYAGISDGEYGLLGEMLAILRQGPAPGHASPARARRCGPRPRRGRHQRRAAHGAHSAPDGAPGFPRESRKDGRAALAGPRHPRTRPERSRPAFHRQPLRHAARRCRQRNLSCRAGRCRPARLRRRPHPRRLFARRSRPFRRCSRSGRAHRRDAPGRGAPGGRQRRKHGKRRRHSRRRRCGPRAGQGRQARLVPARDGRGEQPGPRDARRRNRLARRSKPPGTARCRPPSFSKTISIAALRPPPSTRSSAPRATWLSSIRSRRAPRKRPNSSCPRRRSPRPTARWFRAKAAPSASSVSIPPPATCRTLGAGCATFSACSPGPRG